MTNARDGCEVTKHLIHIKDGKWDNVCIHDMGQFCFQVLEEMERVTRSKVIKFYKVVWNNHSEQDATWEREDYLREVYPAFYEKW